jgi:hypothetical protein
VNRGSTLVRRCIRFSSLAMSSSRLAMISSSTSKIRWRWRRFLFFQFLNLLLQRVLFFDGRGQACLAGERLNALLGVLEFLFGGEHHVIGPFFQLFPCFLQVPVVGLERAADRGFGTPIGLCGQLGLNVGGKR